MSSFAIRAPLNISRSMQSVAMCSSLVWALFFGFEADSDFGKVHWDIFYLIYPSDHDSDELHG